MERVEVNCKVHESVFIACVQYRQAVGGCLTFITLNISYGGTTLTSLGPLLIQEIPLGIMRARLKHQLRVDKKNLLLERDRLNSFGLFGWFLYSKRRNVIRKIARINRVLKQYEKEK